VLIVGHARVGAAAKPGHITPNPVECMRRSIADANQRGEATYEPFHGSGRSWPQPKCPPLLLRARAQLSLAKATPGWQMAAGAEFGAALRHSPECPGQI